MHLSSQSNPIIYKQTDLPKIASELISRATSKILCFTGQMGAGKTTLIKAIVKELGGGNSANSPTFGIVNEYHNTNGNLLGYHFDFYRLEDETEVLDLGFEDYLNQDTWVFIEWPEKISSFLPDDVFEIDIDIVDSNTRKISI
ncbi:tRNA (adenosine(37)-N6)-threonylcarbamoyltransferase complex ATPase subunit type 1 TsaE [Maribacter sp. 2308TA10-17]|uniref:tRNA (adenosine(37)-N6)-threonylcarbamoyltransferase complex ATPase subunit type 1 TsaE n=1 Tax=Maribacter sp. 2308TA10-17 TaxID=3386276 RepID=UPI0039BCF6D7